MARRASSDRSIDLKKISRKRTTYRSEPAYDVRTIGREHPTNRGHFILDGFDDAGVEYFDGQNNRLIWSIGRHIETTEIIASLGSDLYQHPEYECLWLR